MRVKKELLITSAFDTKTKKARLSGILNSANSAEKIVIVYDRRTANVIGITNVDLSDNTWTIDVPYREDETLTVMCRDEGGDFNADIYDRLSLCSADYYHTVNHDTLIMENDKIFYASENPSRHGEVVGYSSIIEEHNLKCNIEYIRMEEDGRLVFEDINNVEQDIGAGTENEDVLAGSRINGYSTITNELTHRVSLDPNYGVNPDIFNDGSDHITMIFEDGIAEDLSGNFNNIYSGYKKCTGKYGHGVESGTFGGQYGPKINISPGMVLTPGNWTTSFWLFADGWYYSTSQGDSVQQMFAYEISTNSAGSLYFRTGNGTAWNAYLIKSMGTGFFLKAWNHICITMEGTAVRFYVNGSLVYTGTTSQIVSPPPYSGIYQLKIGAGAYRNGVFQKIDMFRMFNRAITNAEALALYEEIPLYSNRIDNIYAHTINGESLKINASSVRKPILDLKMEGDWSDKTGNYSTIIPGLETISDSVLFDGIIPIHKLELCSDNGPGGDIGDESNIDVVCRFNPSSISGKNVIWKSGGSVDGVAVGINDGAVGIFGVSGSSETSIEIPSMVFSGGWYKFLYSDNEITIFSDNGQILERKSGTVVIGNGDEQESVGGACAGSPMLANSTGSLHNFSGSISDIEVYGKGTASVEVQDRKKIAAEIGSTGVECQVEIEKWDAYNNECIIWINLPELSSTEDNVIKLYYDKYHTDNDNISYTGVAPELPVGATQDWIDLRTAAEADTIATFEDTVLPGGSTNELPGWNGQKRIMIDLGKPDTSIENFVARIRIGKESGASNFDGSIICSELTEETLIPNTFEKATNFIITNERKTVKYSSSAWKSAIAVSEKTSGKFYFEILKQGANDQTIIGVCSPAMLETLYCGQESGSVGLKGDNQNVFVDGASWTDSQKGFTYTDGDVIGVAVDIDANTIKYSKNGTWYDEISITGTSYVPAVSGYSASNTFTLRTVPGELQYPIPDGFSPWGKIGNAINSKRTAFEIGTTGIETVAQISSMDYGIFPQVPESFDLTTVKATSYFGTSYSPHNAVDPSIANLGGISGKSWLAGGGNHTNQKFNIDLGSIKIIKRICLENLNHIGAAYLQNGIQNFTVYGTNLVDAFNNLTYEDLTDLTELGSFTAREHIASDVLDPQYFTMDHTESFRYYVLRIANDFGGVSEGMGFNHIELQSIEEVMIFDVLFPDYSANNQNILYFYYDPTHEENPNIGYKLSDTAKSVWSGRLSSVYAINDYNIFESKNGTNNGLIIGEDVSFVSTEYGKALQLGGSSYISLLSESSTAEWTFEAFIKPIITESGDGIFVSDGDGIVFADGKIGVMSDNSVSVAGSVVVNDQWIHIAGTSDGKFFENGVEVGAANNNVAWGLSGVTRIGNGSLSKMPKMQIIFTSKSDTVLSDAEILKRAESMLDIAATLSRADATPSGTGTIEGNCTITIPSEKISSDLIDFPLEVVFDSTGSTNFNSTVLFEELSEEGDWKRIIVTDQQRNNLQVEVEKWDSINFYAKLNIKVPLVSSSSDTIININFNKTNEEQPNFANIASCLFVSDDANTSSIKDWSTNNYEVTNSGVIHSDFITPKFFKSSFYFNGTSMTVSNADIAMGLGDFSIDFWIYHAAYSPNEYVIDFGANSGSVVFANGVLRFYNPTTGIGSILYTHDTVVPLNEWAHIAITRSSGYTRAFINGVEVAGAADGYSYIATTLNIGRYGGSGYILTQKYIQDIRIVKGTALWTTNFTPPTISICGGTIGTIGTKQASSVWSNEYAGVFHMNGDDGSMFIDSSPKRNKIVVNVKDATVDDDGFYFDGANYGHIPVTEDLNGIITTEMSFKNLAGTNSGWGGIITRQRNNEQNNGLFVNPSTNAPQIRMTDGTEFNSSVDYKATIDWVNLSIVYESLNQKMYNDGVLESSGTVLLDMSLAENADLFIMAYRANSNMYKCSGSIDRIKLSYIERTPSWISAAAKARRNELVTIEQKTIASVEKKIAYTIPPDFAGITGNDLVNFPTRILIGDVTQANGLSTGIIFDELPSSGDGNDEFTSILIHSDGVGSPIVDSSSNGFTITPTGTTANSDAQKVFGSTAIYFDGDNDGMSVPANPAFDFGTGDFTIDTWVYIQPGLQYQTICSNGYYVNGGWTLQTDNRKVLFYVGTGTLFSYQLLADTWYHLAVVRSGAVITLYVDGVAVETASSTYNYYGGNNLQFGYRFFDNTWDFKGFIDEFRISKIARWTSDFVVPSLPYSVKVDGWKKLLITDSANSPLFSEIEYWDTVNRKASIIVKVPTLSLSEETKLIINYSSKNDDNSYTNVSGTTASQNVWNDYLSVFNMSQDFLSLIDSANISNSVSQTGLLGNSIIDGDYNDKVALFNGSGQKINCSVQNASVINDFTVIALVKINSTQIRDYPLIVTSESGGAQGTGSLFASDAVTSNRVAYTLGSSRYLDSVSDLKDNLWHMIIVERSGTTLNMFVDDTLVDTAIVSTVANWSDMTIGFGDYSPTNTSFVGEISRICFSNSTFTNDYKTALRKLLLENPYTVQQVYSGTGDPLLQTWESGKSVTITIAASDVNSDMAGFKMPIRISPSSGITGYNLSSWLSDLMYTSSISSQNIIAKYLFGGNRDGMAGFKTSTILFDKNNTHLINSAIKFTSDGNQVITLDNKVKLKFAENDITVAFWIKPTKPTVVMDVMGSNYGGEISVMLNTNRTLAFYCGYSISYYNLITTSIDSIPNDTWTHVTYVRNRSSAVNYVYINGKLDVTAVMNRDIAPDIAPLKIGNSKHHPTTYLTASLSNLMLFDINITGDQVLELYNDPGYNTYKNKFIVTIFKMANVQFPFLLGENISSIYVETNSNETTMLTSIAFTFDGDTYKAYKNLSWRNIATRDESIHGNVGDSDWYYVDDLDQWNKSSKAGLNYAISIASDFEENYMSKAEAESITQNDFDLVFDPATGIFDIAVGIKSTSDGSVTEVNKIIINDVEYWSSSIYNLEEYDGLFTTSIVKWSTRDYNNDFKVFVIKSGDTQWTECTVNGGQIPGITQGMSTVGVEIQFKVEFANDRQNTEEFDLEFELI